MLIELNDKSYKLLKHDRLITDGYYFNKHLIHINTLPYFNLHIGNIRRTADETEFYITNDYLNTPLQVTPVIFKPHYKSLKIR